MAIARSSSAPDSGHSVGARDSAITGAIGPAASVGFCESPEAPQPVNDSTSKVQSDNSKIFFFIKIPSQSRE